MREWMIALGILVVVAVALNCVRRIRANNRDALQWSNNLGRGMQSAGGEDPLGLDAGVSDVRVSHRHADDANDEEDEEEDHSGLTATRGSLDLSQPVPILMDVDVKDTARIEPGLGSDDLGLEDTQSIAPQRESSGAELDGDVLDNNASDDEMTAPVLSSKQTHFEGTSTVVRPVLDPATTPLMAGDSDVVSAPRIFDRPPDQPPPRRAPPVKREVKPVITAQREKAQRLEQSSAEQQTRQQALLLEEYVLVNVMARDKNRFSGTALLEALVANGLRYGHRNLFHYYVGEDREDESVFCVVNALKPGTFDLNHMEDFNTPGIGFILRLPVSIRSMEAFELMMDTAQRLATALNGELRDEHRNIMTAQTIEHGRERVRHFEMQLHAR